MTSVTVILPVHNGAAFLAEAITSVLSQTHRDLELHVLDDCSSDASPVIVRQMQASDPRIRYSRNAERSGLFRTLNRAFAEADTSWVRIRAHDDRMMSECLAKMLAFACANPTAGMIYCNYTEIDVLGQRTDGERQFDLFRNMTPDIMGPTVAALYFFLYGCLPGNISTVLMRRDVWKQVGGFIEGIQQAPDYDMWVRVSEVADIGFVRERLIELRAHSLQLGRLGQKLMTTIAEERPVIERLRSRLANVMPTSVFDAYWRSHRGRQHVHWVARAILRGDFRLAWRGWCDIARYGQPIAQLICWALTLNGRYQVPDPNTLCDKYKNECSRKDVLTS